MSTTEKYRYDGGIDMIDVKLPTGRWLTVSRGDEVDLLPNEATAVSDLPGWTKVTPVPSRPTEATDTKKEKA